MSRPIPPGDLLDPDRPYLAHQLVGPEIAQEITGLSPSQQKRARQDGLLKFYRHRGMAILYKVADLYEYRDAMFVAVDRKPKITRTRSAEHNEKIAASVRAARAKKSPIAEVENDDELVWE